jgi:hypothetical protein
MGLAWASPVALLCAPFRAAVPALRGGADPVRVVPVLCGGEG